ncbi:MULTISPECIES: alpha/beta fold hydrolase [Kordiimonas]|jgi:pimeloyl-ACP methyl ester carboxylesterase|uniref:alpha/beta fold hydrolase n=1 Tax=Kordiimonas TaxID=288021 RepID=UPI00257BA1C6|nr:alpha/beta hydrolase [Kordiimonas sp. UBA4487]
MTQPSFLKTDHGTKIAYHKSAGYGPGVVFLGGFMSDMEGGKALELEAYCRRVGRAFVRFDYFGHGQSSGAFADGTIGLWLKDALAVIDWLTEGPQILVGSSMGGWVSLLAAKARPGRVKGLVGIAAAPDFTVWHWDAMSAEDQQTIIEEGRLEVYSDYGPDPYVFTKELFDDGWQNRINNGPIHLDIPVRLIQGTADADVPWQTALKIADNITGEDTEVILVPGGDHRLSRDVDLKRLVRVTDSLIAEVAGR